MFEVYSLMQQLHNSWLQWKVNKRLASILMIQNLRVTLRDMRSSQVIGEPPTNLLVNIRVRCAPHLCTRVLREGKR